MKGHVCKRGNTWAAVLYLGRGDDGKPKYKWSSHRTRREAEAYVAQMANILHGGGTVPNTRLKTREWLTQWIHDNVAVTAAPKTLASYREIVNVHLIPAMGHIHLTKLSPAAIQAMAQEKLDSGLSSTTARYIVSVLGIALNRAVKLGLIARNPVALVEKPKKADREMLVLNQEETRHFLATAQEKAREYYALFLTAVMTGMRQGELLGLRWSDLDLEQGVARITQIAQRMGDTVTFKAPKTPRSRRTIPLSETVTGALRKRKADVMERRLLFGAEYNNLDLVFCQPDGKPLHAGNISQRVLPRILKAAKLRRIPFHGLRHCHASLLLAQGVNPKIVSERLGHSAIGITLQTYSALLPGIQEKAISELDAALFEGEPERILADISKTPYRGVGSIR